MTWYSGSSGPFDDPVEAAAVDRMLEAVALLDADAPSSEGDWVVIAAPDVVDGDDQEGLARAVFAADGDVLIDLSDTSLLTARGSRSLHQLHRGKGQAGRTVALKGATGIVRQVIDITGLGSVVPVVRA